MSLHSLGTKQEVISPILKNNKTGKLSDIETSFGQISTPQLNTRVTR